MEHKTISVQIFRSKDGEPTCCADHPAGQTCRFLGVRNFGTVDVCMLGEQRDLAPRTNDFQRPDARCEVWADALTDGLGLAPERAEFEGYFSDSRRWKGPSKRPTFSRLADGTYADDCTQRHWWTCSRRKPQRASGAPSCARTSATSISAAKARSTRN